MMDRGIWATWYDLPKQGKDEYLAWLHGTYLPEMLARPGYLWAAHVENIMSPEREQRSITIKTTDPSVPGGNNYLLLFGAESPHIFMDPPPAELNAQLPAEAQQMLSRRITPRSCVFVEVDRVDGPAVKQRAPGITPGPVIQLGTFNIDALENEDALEAWYARARLPLMGRIQGCVGARKLVSISGWAKHGILYEFVSLEAVEQNFKDPEDWWDRVIKHLVHAPHSPSLGQRIWP
jgi:hypothetical protein